MFDLFKIKVTNSTRMKHGIHVESSCKHGENMTMSECSMIAELAVANLLFECLPEQFVYYKERLSLGKNKQSSVCVFALLGLSTCVC